MGHVNRIVQWNSLRSALLVSLLALASVLVMIPGTAAGGDASAAGLAAACAAPRTFLHSDTEAGRAAPPASFEGAVAGYAPAGRRTHSTDEQAAQELPRAAGASQSDLPETATRVTSGRGWWSSKQSTAWAWSAGDVTVAPARTLL